MCRRRNTLSNNYTSVVVRTRRYKNRSPIASGSRTRSIILILNLCFGTEMKAPVVLKFISFFLLLFYFVSLFHSFNNHLYKKEYKKCMCSNNCLIRNVIKGYYFNLNNNNLPLKRKNNFFIFFLPKKKRNEKLSKETILY